MSSYPLFEEEVWNYYSKNQRDLPWRKPESDGSFDPYKILVSEVMLQQTQVQRVIPKYHDFLRVFPDLQSLAQASLQQVFEQWNGLGYNRRAKFLREAAAQIINKHDGKIPKNIDQLIELPGIGRNTAAAILVYCYNQPLVFIETNIRTVYIHNFFNDQSKVSDSELMPFIMATLDHENPREWYWALMDYGANLKAMVGNVSRKSKHYARQSVFEGSRRQLRARVLKNLLGGPKTYQQLYKTINDERLGSVLVDLTKERFIKVAAKRYSLI